MINPFRDTNWKPGLKELRAFAHSLLLGFPVLALVFALILRWRLQAWPSWPLWLGAGGFALGTLCWCLPRLARPIYLVWYALSGAVGLVVSNGVLALIFYLVVTPIGLILRICGRDALRRKWDRSASTYWIPSRPNTDSRDYFRPS